MKNFIRGGNGFDVTLFQMPPSEVCPIYTWNWNAPLNRSTIRRQIDEMSEAGIRAVYVLPEPYEFRPHRMATCLTPPYMSDEFLQYYRDAAEYASQRGMALWLYDEGGFPSGMACGQVVGEIPSAIASRIATQKRTVKAGEPYLPSPDSLAAFDETGKRIDNPPHQTDRIITEYTVCPIYPFEPKVPLNTNIALKSTAESFVRHTHEKYRTALSDSPAWDNIPAVFTDEPGLYYPVWTDEIAAEFQNRYGYSLTDSLPYLFTADDGEKGEQIRLDYSLLVGEILKRNYFDVIHDWCRQNGKYATGHLDHDNSLMGSHTKQYGSQLHLLSAFDIPGVDVIWRQIFRRENPIDGGYGSGSIDNVFYPRFASSAANQNGGNLAMSENFAVYGNGLCMDDMRYVSGYLYIRGINIMNMMSVSYARSDATFFAMPHPLFVKEFAGYTHLHLINGYLARMSYLTSLGRREVKVALTVPVRDVLCRGRRETDAITLFETLGTALEQNGIDFDVIDEYAIDRADVNNGKLSVGNAVYEVILCPDCFTLSLSAKEKLNHVCVENDVDSVKKHLSPVLSADCGFRKLRVMKRNLPNGRLYFVYNESCNVVDTMVTLSETLPMLRLDCTDGTAVIPEMQGTDGRVSVKLSIPSGDTAVLFATSDVIPTVTVGGERKIIPLAAFTAKPIAETVLNERGVFRYDRKDEAEAVTLGAWQYGKEFSGEVCYHTSFYLEKVGKSYRLSLGIVKWSAKVLVNQKTAGYAGLLPNEITLDGSVLCQGENSLDIIVANTAANVFASFPAKDYWDERFLSSYYDRERTMEQDSLESGLYGDVVLYESF